MQIKRIFATIFICVFLFAASVLYTQHANKNDVILAQFQQQNLMMTSVRQLEICHNQTDVNPHNKERHCSEYSTKQTLEITTKPNWEMDVTVFYEDINITKSTYINNEELQANQYQLQSEEEFDLIYKCQLDGFGRIRSIKEPEGQKYEQGVRLTERLLAQTFPDIRAFAYGRNNLRQNNADEIEFHGYLGDVVPNYDKIDTGDKIILHKTYSEDDFTNFEYQLGGELPEVDYSSDIVINKESGIVTHGEMTMTFMLDETQEMYDVNEDRILVDHSERENEYQEILGQIDVEINQNIDTVGVAWIEELHLELEQYKSTHNFVTVDLDDDSGELEVLDSNVEPEILLGVSASYTKKWDVFKKAILGNTVALGVEWNNYENFSVVDANIWLNNNKLFTLYSRKLEHPWLACTPKKVDFKDDKIMQIFRVNYPIAGVINIPVTARIGVNFGYIFEVKNTKSQNQLCNVNFKPHMKPFLEGSGGASILKIAEGGVYARGYVADTTLDFGFQANTVNLSYGRIYGKATFKPFSFEVGAYYWVIKCSFKKFFKKLLSFRWKEICEQGPRKQIPFLKDSLANMSDRTIFDQSITLKR